LRNVLSEDRLSGEGHLHRLRAAHAGRKSPETATASERPNIHLGDAEFQASGGDYQVATESEREAATVGKALDRSDQGLCRPCVDEHHERTRILIAHESLEIHPG
jgi:hypothetical protein